ncbi:MAG: ATP-dependent zinc metalloprotease FtsH [Leptospirales bacterium]|nr:ATP-dependent zinc metalloprotease FtsH [Leptospirales bacterium]
MNNRLKQVAFFLFLCLIVLAIFKIPNWGTEKVNIDYNVFLDKVEKNEIAKVRIGNEKIIYGKYKSSDEKNNKYKPEYDFVTTIPYNDPALIKTLIDSNVSVEGFDEDDNILLKGFISFLPFLLLFGFIWFLMFRQIQGAGNKALAFGKSKAKLNPDLKNKVNFKDVAGAEEAKEELREIVDFLAEPKKFIAIGAKIPKGVLLVGPPGTGKTLLARAIAGEAGVHFFSISGSDFVEMFVGVGASRVRDLFEQGKKNAPCIIFIDEIDAVGRLRGAGLGGGHDEREQTLNQLLVEMDGFETNEGVIIIAATNRPDVLDPALIRPGRFDRQVVVDIPDIKGREKILAVHTKKIPLSREVDLKIIARGTPGFTGADLANLVNEGALLAARRNKKRVGMDEMEEAKDKVLMGPERRSMLISDSEKENTAYHEAGHAIIGIITGSDPIHKVTIIPRGRALGVTMQLPTEERLTQSKNYCLKKIQVLFGGHLAEQLKFNEVTNGSGSDIAHATSIARKMVTEWGMSEKIGPILLASKQEHVFLGREISQNRNFSDATAQLIDEEVNSIIQFCLDEGKKILIKEREKFESLAKNLIERETLDAEELKILMSGEELPPLAADKSAKKTAQNDKQLEFEA